MVKALPNYYTFSFFTRKLISSIKVKVALHSTHYQLIDDTLSVFTTIPINYLLFAYSGFTSLGFSPFL